MTKGIALLAFSLALEAAFLFQVSVIARPERTSVPASAIAEVITEADGETVARSPVLPAPRS